IGLPTAVLLAKSGFEVLGVDVNASVIARLNSGRAHIVEPGIQEALEEALDSERLTFSAIPKKADVHIIAVPTPLTSEKKPDLDYVFSAAHSLLPILKGGDLIIIESTIPVGTTEL